jgi:hypothetical protein
LEVFYFAIQFSNNTTGNKYPEEAFPIGLLNVINVHLDLAWSDWEGADHLEQVREWAT